MKKTKISQFEPLPANMENLFQVIWDSQLMLMEAYREAGRLSDWPMDMNIEEDQNFYRTLMGFLEEELFEAQDSYEAIYEGLTHSDKITEIIEAYNEETADSLCFWIELFIFMDLTPDTFREYYERLSIEKGRNPRKGDPFAQSFKFAESTLNFHDSLSNLNLQATTYTFSQDPLHYVDYRVGGKTVSAQHLRLYNHYLLYCVKNLQMARNLLKNKYWKKEQTPVDRTQFTHFIFEAWINWTMCLVISGHMPGALTKTFTRKVQLNHERLTK